ncbi:UvrD-helicase domain-containing protein [Curtobacterium sp. MCJR17_043]|uniref:UvrD-helicase domain-containing protein n=1 Tax=Curtobacterium sp. MCJR17_043 TaxID=2175660 RepID=UPI0024E00D79|nr:UvrD-helicase domain-containing protein [Curtobacterium sp. MCJR17_043]WIB36725.1 AAA family ATPase [Curtobacterium sp. MCJR17_043]
MPPTTLTPAPDLGSVSRALVEDPAQQAVLALPDGEHAAVFGAPGTGKTSTLTRLVADRIARPGAVDAAGHATVLALTSARMAATALRDRLAAAVDRVTPGALARTVNSLAFQVVAHAATVQGQDAPTLLTGGEQDRILADLLAGHELDGGGPDWPAPITAVVRERAGFRTALRDLMMRAVAAGIEPDDMRELGDETGHPEWRAVGDLVDEYRATVTAFRTTALDAAELVAFATAAVLRGGTSRPRWPRCVSSSSTTCRNSSRARSPCSVPSPVPACRSSRSATRTSPPRPSAARSRTCSAASVRASASPASGRSCSARCTGTPDRSGRW